jgi:hypothetical protein
MKELSIEEKARRYDEAIEKAKIWQEHLYDVNDKDYADELNYIFPELKESEDERIELLNYLYDVHDDDEERARWIAWLEKQGEQKPAIETKLKIEKGKWYICISQYYNCIEGRVYKATSDSRIMDDFGTEYDMHSDAYKYFRPWTIQDAKNGDVLSYRDGQWIFIYKEKIDDKSFYYHTLHSTTQGLTIDNVGFTLLNDAISPATKEQRDTLEKAMADAGYTFDFEKKELKKIEQKSTITPKFKVGDIIRHIKIGFTCEITAVNDTEYKVSGYSGGSATSLPFDFQDAWELVEQKPTAWSEEDEYLLDETIKHLEVLIRITKKQGSAYSDEIQYYQRDIDWLKSLRPQSQWKPDSSMLTCLEYAIKHINKDGDKGILSKLLEQLKQL